MGGERQHEAEAMLRVLRYLQQMEDVCTRLHREEIAQYYRDGYEFYAQRVYGPLPSRWATFLQRPAEAAIAEPEQPKQVPGWKREMLAKPLRKVIATIERSEKDHIGRELVTVYEILECRHENALYPGETPARRRRCSACAAAAARKPQQNPQTETQGGVKGKRA